MREPYRLHRLVTFTVLICTFYLACCSSGSDTTSSHQLSKPSELRRGIGGEPETLDPGKADDEFSFEVVRDLFEGLVTEAADGSLLPGVADNWEVDPSGKRYTFRIRSTAQWSNGQRVTADQFVATWRRAVDPKTASPIADSFRLLIGANEIIQGKARPETLGVSSPSQDVLIVDLVQPAPFFPQLLTHSATFPVFSASSASTHNPDMWVSNGPYVLQSWVPGSTIQLAKNARYWGRAAVRISRIAYIPVADDSAELRQYKAGELDITHSVPSGDLADLKATRPSELLIAPFLGTAYYALNLRASPILKDKAVRQALAMAVDRTELQKSILPFGQKVAYGFVPPGTLNYETQHWPWRELSAEERKREARRLFLGSSASTRKSFRLKLLFNSSPNVKRMAIAVASMWKATLGIDCELIDEEYRVFLDSRKNTSRWDVVRLGWTADFNDATSFLDTFRQSSPNNDSGFNSAQYDDLLNQASKTINRVERQSLLQRAETAMLNEYPIIPLYFYTSKRLVKANVHGAASNPLNRMLSKNLYLD